MQSEVFVCFLPAANQKPPPSTSLHSAAAAGLDPGPANVQPGQLGAIFKELFDGNVTHVQLRCQRVFLLHGNCQLLKDLCEEREEGWIEGISIFIHKAHTHTHCRSLSCGRAYVVFQIIKHEQLTSPSAVGTFVEVTALKG